MLSDDTIKNLVDILVKREEKVSNKILKIFAKRINEIGTLKSSDLLKLEQLLRNGADMRKISQELAKLTVRQTKDIHKLLQQVAKDNYSMAEPYFKAKNLSYIPFKDNLDLQRVIKAIEKQTLGTYENITKTTAYMMIDKNGKLHPTTISKAYTKIMDEAVQYTQSGLEDYKLNMRYIVKNMMDRGLRTVSYASSGKIYSQRLDSAVKRTILDGVRAINQGVQDEVGKEFGADGVELTVHANPAPDHEPIQGHIFTNEEYKKMQNNEAFQDVKGTVFPPLKRVIGQWNCRHFAYNILVETTVPTYTDEQLQSIIDKNQYGMQLEDGKWITKYEVSQLQRQYELNIRRAKDSTILAREAGMKDLEDISKKKVKQLTAEYKEMSKKAGVKTKPENLFVEDYIV